MNSLIVLNPVETIVTPRSIDGHECAFTGLTARGELIRLWVPDEATSAAFGRDKRPGSLSFPKTQTESSFPGKVGITNASETRFVHLANLTCAFPKVQTLPDDEVLVASSRCRRFPDGKVELNAKIYRADGSMKAEFCIGDAVEHLQADLEGRIWAAYFDEGVFGNYGWGLAGGPRPIGAAGLVCFDTSGERIWEYSPPAGFAQIDDCYVLNVGDDEVWILYYRDFPIVRIGQDFKSRGWQTELSGPRQMAVAGDMVIAYGGYGGKKNDCWLLRLANDAAGLLAEVKLCLPDGINLDESTVIGRSDSLHVVADNLWIRFEVPA